MNTSRPSLVIAGATGFIGSYLVKAAVSAGYHVTRLVRSLPPETPLHCTDVVWEPSAHKVDETVMAGATGVICLNGAPLIGKAWTKSYKKLLWDSRIDSVQTLVEGIRRLSDEERPECFISGSAIGFYESDSGDLVLNEGMPSGTGFLADLCSSWESCAQRCEDEAGVRTVMIRTGLVMGADGGMLGILQHLYRAGLGGPLSDGSAWMSTISLIDHVRAILYAVVHPVLHGPINAVCPQPVRNQEWNALLARHLHRPAVIRIPLKPLSWLFPHAIGETIMASQRVVPVALLDAGFTFTAPTVTDIFCQALPQR
ncbi:hypothetical protein SAMN04489737_1542 [Arcanobacterium phocae]|uniref:TIGR01777 family protein n=1 Tax=Arcanobacterium phocae TaxID=131112 RepID=A0A1H2LKJ0_9ACTO|nr:TIGR01777 family oxidoreductase [Arcanobacterium phocae]SDU81527.1 hypothetical protein SAMN04489737_1542 [Arcanobacterium phocae]